MVIHTNETLKNSRQNFSGHSISRRGVFWFSESLADAVFGLFTVIFRIDEVSKTTVSYLKNVFSVRFMKKLLYSHDGVPVYMNVWTTVFTANNIKRVFASTFHRQKRYLWGKLW